MKDPAAEQLVVGAYLASEQGAVVEYTQCREIAQMGSGKQEARKTYVFLAF